MVDDDQNTAGNNCILLLKLVIGVTMKCSIAILCEVEREEEKGHKQGKRLDCYRPNQPADNSCSAI